MLRSIFIASMAVTLAACAVEQSEFQVSTYDPSEQHNNSHGSRLTTKDNQAIIQQARSVCGDDFGISDVDKTSAGTYFDFVCPVDSITSNNRNISQLKSRTDGLQDSQYFDLYGHEVERNIDVVWVALKDVLVEAEFKFEDQDNTSYFLKTNRLGSFGVRERYIAQLFPVGDNKTFLALRLFLYDRCVHLTSTNECISAERPDDREVVRRFAENFLYRLQSKLGVQPTQT